MLGVFISSFDEVGKHVFKELILFVEVSSMASETAMAALAEILKHQDMDIKQICLWYLIPCLANQNCSTTHQKLRITCNLHKLSLPSF